MAGKKILLVEGKDDENVLKHICGNQADVGIHLDEVKNLGGVDEARWKAYLLRPSREVRSGSCRRGHRCRYQYE